MYDVITIGAGPTGSTVSKILAEKVKNIHYSLATMDIKKIFKKAVTKCYVAGLTFTGSYKNF